MTDTLMLKGESSDLSVSEDPMRNVYAIGAHTIKSGK